MLTKEQYLEAVDVIETFKQQMYESVINSRSQSKMKQLRLSTTKPYGMFSDQDDKLLVEPSEIGELVKAELKGKTAYIHGEAEKIAGFDIPTFIDGNMGQLTLPIEQQDILLLLPDGEYKCKSEYCDAPLSSNCYLITLSTEPRATTN